MADQPAANPPDPDTQSQKLLARCYKAATAYGRPDLAARVLQLLERLTDDALRVMVVGEFKHGKSTLVNTILGEDLCPVDGDIATSTPILVRNGKERRATAIVEVGAEGSGDTDEVTVAIEELDRWTTETGNPDNRRRVRRVEVEVPNPILQAGIALVDTPGVGGLASTHGTITSGALPMADAVLFLSDASQELAATELEFLRTVVRICPTVAYVITKIDVHHHWRRIVELDEGHLARAGIELPMFSVSSVLQQLADADEDDSLADDSGFGPLLRWLGRSVARAGRQRTLELVAAEIDQVTGQLAAPFVAEQGVLEAVDASALVAELERAKARADALRGGAGRWSSVLADGFGDLQSDVDHDMRSRMRDLNRKVDDMIDGFDPADAWAEFEPWLYRETGAVVTANYTLLVERVRSLVEDVSEVFGVEGLGTGADFVARLTAADELVSAAGTGADLNVSKSTVVSQGLSVLRGGYSAVGMFGMYAGMAGVVLSNPISAALALVMGRKGLKDERERQLSTRRAQAKAAARRYVDDVNFVVGKDSRDAMRHLQRDLRAWFTARAEEASTSASAALAAAQAAVAQGTDGRQQRLDDIAAELRRLETLRSAAAQLAADHGEGTS
jgi:hypothetical protein